MKFVKNNRIKNLISIIKQKVRVKKRKPVLSYLETHLVDHCNLNCKACSHYSPLAQDTFVDVEEYEKNIRVLSKKIRFKSIRLLGGEPLLHPKIVDFIKVTKECYPKANISIVTNGMLLSKMNDVFWAVCRENNVFIDISKYPILKEQFEEYISLIKSKNVFVGDIHECSEVYVFHNPLGDSNINISYKNCAVKRYKILKGNKLYGCPKAAYIDIFNKYYNIPAQKDAGIDIERNLAKKIVKHLNNPTHICKFCSYAPMQVKWELSKRNQEDWNVVEDLSKLQAFQNFILKDMQK